MKPSLKTFLPLVILFVVISIVILLCKRLMEQNNIPVNFIFGANVIVFVITFLGFIVQMRGASASNINAFLRGVYASLLLKMFIVLGAVFIYALATDGSIHQVALLLSLALYIIYTAVEVMQLMKIVRNKPNA